MCKFVVLRPQAWLDNFKMELKSTAFIWFNFESVSAICRLRYALESLACQQTKFPSCHSSLQYPLQNWADCLALLWLHDRKCLPRKVSKTSKVSKYPTVKVSLVNLHMQHHPANLSKNNVTITFDEFYKNSSRLFLPSHKTSANMTQIDGAKYVITSAKKMPTLMNCSTLINQMCLIEIRLTDDREMNTPIW